MQEPIENKLNTVVDNSGNSDVDININIEIDTKSIAYRMLCSLYAKGDISENDLENAIQKLDALIEKNNKLEKLIHNISNENQLNPSNPQQKEKKQPVLLDYLSNIIDLYKILNKST